MSRKLRRRVTMAAGASIAGVAIPIAAAFNAWADTDISYDGITLYDDFGGLHLFGTSDVGTPAESGLNNDWAFVFGPASDNVAGLANDSYAGDVGDVAFWSGTAAPTNVFGEEGAQIVNGTNSDALVFGGGNAPINLASNGIEDPVNTSSAIAMNGGFADVSNDGLAPTGVTVANDYAFANGTATDTLTNGTAQGLTPSVANIYDSGSSWSIANDTGTNLFTGNGGAAVDLGNNDFAYAVNPDSAANIIGTGTTPVVDSSDIVNNGGIVDILTSNTFAIDGIPDATFVADLFGADGVAGFTTAWTDLLGLF